MKFLAILSVALLASAAASSPAPQSSHRCAMICVDDPPPERDDCPLCGGDPALHARRVFALAKFAAWSTACALPR